MSKDAEIERAFKQAEKDAERRALPGALFPGPIPLWKDPEPCPDCDSDQVLAAKPGKVWRGMCIDCGHVWEPERPPTETDNEGENNGT